MAQPSNVPTDRTLSSESDLKRLLDQLFTQTKEAQKEGKKLRFKGLLEHMKSEITIRTAIYNLKSNKGSQTPGSDGETMREHMLEKDESEVISRVQRGLTWYTPQLIRRKYIEKPGKRGKRPLGIPAIIDRVVQECIRIIIEPILEAQFFPHSYGFRPLRDAHMALQRTTFLTHSTGYHWVIEGDIHKFFDCVSHTKLIKMLYGMGIKDQRVLMMIKAMLRAGIMKETTVNTLGTAQGGVISPLLANVYLHHFDQGITREWENKKTRTTYGRTDSQRLALKRNSHLKPAYLVRYADDWILITDTKAHAEKWKRRISTHLKTHLRLSLSEEKTNITNIREKPIHFLGFECKLVKGKSRTGYITRTRPDRNRLKSKIQELYRKVNALKRSRGRVSAIQQIDSINASIRGIIRYYECTTWVNIELAQYALTLRWKAKRALDKYGGIWLPAKETHNLRSVHAEYLTRIPAIAYKGRWIGVTDVAFSRWRKTDPKDPRETPYSAEGRARYQARTGRTFSNARVDDMLATYYTEVAHRARTDATYNFEYFLNSAYALNRDRGKCRVCGEWVEQENLSIHRIQPHLPLGMVNRVNNLATVHASCHRMIHSEQDSPSLNKKIRKKLLTFREKN